MPVLQVHRSNQMERLAEALADLVAHPLADPMAPECIVVEGRGIERWLARQLADRLGIWAHSEFIFPRRLLQRAFDAFLGPQAKADESFEPESLTWTIAALLPTLLDGAAFAPVHGYLGDQDPARRLALAQRLADTLDHYVVYRPEMVLRWETGVDDDWQAQLWRAIVARRGSNHLAARCRAFFSAGRRAPQTPLPQRLSLVGLSTLAPLYLRVFDALAQHCDVHLFLLNPSAAYWGTVRSRREVLRDRWRADPDGLDLEAEIDTAAGHPLLASLGRVGRDFQEVLEASCQYHEDDVPLHQDPGTGSILATIQSDLLTLTHRRLENTRLPVPPGDDSIRIHACHAAVREVQVLRDQLLALFEADPTLQTHEVVVLCPTIDIYAPLVQAVFGGDGDEARLPFRIADLQRRSTDVAVDAFLHVLTLLGGRLGAAEVVDVLELPGVHARFALSTSDVEVVRGWIADAGIRWGADAEHRADAGQPGLDENTWRFGLDRLFLGFAMESDGSSTYAGLLPLDGIEGTQAAALGGFADFCEALFHWRTLLASARRLTEWRAPLLSLLDSFIAEQSDTVEQHVAIRTAIDEVIGRAGRAGFDEPIEVAALVPFLEAALQQSAPGRGFLTGGITFCAPVPMRSIPFRVVCLLGMNDVDFPRSQPAPGFDHMARHPKAGDRNPRDDDRYLFLEALLAARERVIITYIGHGVRDNAPLPPSAVISELLDVVDATFVGDDPDVPVSPSLIVDHPLQPFSPRYFDASVPAWFSYSQRHCDAARGLLAPSPDTPPFLSTTLAPPAVIDTSLGLDRLLRFVAHPTRAFLQHRLGLYLRDTEPSLDSREPLTLNGLERWQLGSELLDRLRADNPASDLERIVRASGRLPAGTLGHCALEEVQQLALELAAAATPFRSGTPLPPQAIEFAVDGCQLSGVLPERWTSGVLLVHFGKLNGGLLLAAWLQHLFMLSAESADCAAQTTIVARATGDPPATVLTLGAVADPQAQLAAWLECYRLGLLQPLPLFRKASLAYIEELRKSELEDKALAAARKAYRGGFNAPGEGEDPYLRQVFGSDEPLPVDPDYPLFDAKRPDLAFAPLARHLFLPLFEHLGDDA